MSKDLNPRRALIFRITHRDNLGWLLRNGIHCASSGMVDPNFISIGNPELINRRAKRALPPPFGGMLSDYVPFYFTPYSPMMFNIKTGWAGIAQRANDDIVILVSSRWKLREEGIGYVFSDRHAYLAAAQFYDDPSDLNKIDWPILQTRDFRRDEDYPEKVERYEAECLARGHVPVRALLGVACHSKFAHDVVSKAIREANVTLKTIVQPGWYFQ